MLKSACLPDCLHPAPSVKPSPESKVCARTPTPPSIQSRQDFPPPPGFAKATSTYIFRELGILRIVLFIISALRFADTFICLFFFFIFSIRPSPPPRENKRDKKKERIWGGGEEKKIKKIEKERRQQIKKKLSMLVGISMRAYS